MGMAGAVVACLVIDGCAVQADSLEPVRSLVEA
jgi:hypothetical protein